MKNKTIKKAGKKKKNITQKNCDEFDKQEIRNKIYKLKQNYSYPSNFIIFTDTYKIESKNEIMHYTVQSHALKHINTFGKECNAGFEDVHIHEVYNPYTKKILENKEKAEVYKQILESHVTFIHPLIKQALKQEYIQKTFECGLHNTKLPGQNKNSIFDTNKPITIYFFDKHDTSENQTLVSITGQ